MRNFIAGFLCAIVLFSVIGATSFKPSIVGGSGKLEGVEVLGADGKKQCEDPQYFEANRIISCY